jgi:hypothetical protein
LPLEVSRPDSGIEAIACQREDCEASCEDFAVRPGFRASGHPSHRPADPTRKLPGAHRAARFRARTNSDPHFLDMAREELA